MGCITIRAARGGPELTGSRLLSSQPASAPRRWRLISLGPRSRVRLASLISYSPAYLLTGPMPDILIENDVPMRKGRDISNHHVDQLA